MLFPADGFTHLAQFLECGEAPEAQEFWPRAAIESFDVRLLIGLARLNEDQRDAVRLAAAAQRLGHEFRAVRPGSAYTIVVAPEVRCIGDVWSRAIVANELQLR